MQSRTCHVRSPRLRLRSDFGTHKRLSASSQPTRRAPQPHSPPNMTDSKATADVKPSAREDRNAVLEAVPVIHWAMTHSLTHANRNTSSNLNMSMEFLLMKVIRLKQKKHSRRRAMRLNLHGRCRSTGEGQGGSRSGQAFRSEAQASQVSQISQYCTVGRTRARATAKKGIVKQRKLEDGCMRFRISKATLRKVRVL